MRQLEAKEPSLSSSMSGRYLRISHVYWTGRWTARCGDAEDCWPSLLSSLINACGFLALLTPWNKLGTYQSPLQTDLFTSCHNTRQLRWRTDLFCAGTPEHVPGWHFVYTNLRHTRYTCKLSPKVKNAKMCHRCIYNIHKDRWDLTGSSCRIWRPSLQQNFFGMPPRLPVVS